MSARALPVPGAALSRADTLALAGLGAGLAAWCLLFRPEIVAAVRVWRSSTAFGHCFLVLPIALWLAWDRRRVLAGEIMRPAPWAASLAVPMTLGWLAAERLGLMEGRQLVAVGLLQLLFLSVLGRRLWWGLAVPLLYLFFLVPFGAFLVPWLQRFTAGFVGVGLDVLGIPHLVTDLRIEIPSGAFRIAEACAGLRFLIAAIAFGVLYACLLYRGTGKRLAFVVASIVVPIVANGFRALGIVVLGDVLGDPAAAMVDHVLYGWLFFSLVIVAMILLGLPFRDDVATPTPPPPPPFPPRALPVAPTPCPSRMARAVGGVLLVAASGPAMALAFDARAAAEQAAIPASSVAGLLNPLQAPSGCRFAETPDRPPMPRDDLPRGGANGLANSGSGMAWRHLDCPDAQVTIVARAFSRHTKAATLIAARRDAALRLGETAAGRTLIVPGGVPGWILFADPGARRAVAMNLVLRGADGSAGAGGDWALRLWAARSSSSLVDAVLGDATPPLVLLAISAEAIGDAATVDDAAARIAATLRVSPGLGRWMYAAEASRPP